MRGRGVENDNNMGGVMKTLRTASIYFRLVFIFILCRGIGLSYDKSDIDPNEFESPVEISEPIQVAESVDPFEYAELTTGFSAEILRGIAAAESRFSVKAVGDGGMSLGMFQLHSRWHESRVKKWGEFDPVDPFESAVIAGWIMQENLREFNGDLRTAVAAYRQGVKGVKKNGVADWYVDEVLNWQNDPEKIVFFFNFRGITKNEAL